VGWTARAASYSSAGPAVMRAWMGRRLLRITFGHDVAPASPRHGPRSMIRLRPDDCQVVLDQDHRMAAVDSRRRERIIAATSASNCRPVVALQTITIIVPVRASRAPLAITGSACPRKSGDLQGCAAPPTESVTA